MLLLRPFKKENINILESLISPFTTSIRFGEYHICSICGPVLSHMKCIQFIDINLPHIKRICSVYAVKRYERYRPWPVNLKRYMAVSYGQCMGSNMKLPKKHVKDDFAMWYWCFFYLIRKVGHCKKLARDQV